MFFTWLAVCAHWFGQFYFYHHKQEFGHILCCIALYLSFQTPFSLRRNGVKGEMTILLYYTVHITIPFTTKLLILFEFFLSIHSFYRFLTILSVCVFFCFLLVAHFCPENFQVCTTWWWKLLRKKCISKRKKSWEKNKIK